MTWLEGEGQGVKGGIPPVLPGGDLSASADKASDEEISMRRLKEGLGLAARRNDELAIRRVWGRLSDLPMPGRRRAVPTLLASAVLLAAGVGAVSFALSLRIAEVEPPIARVGQAAAEIASRPIPPGDVPMLLGPATLQTGAGEARRVRLKGGAMVAIAAQTTLTVDAGQRPSITRGRIELEVPRQPPGDQFTVEAGPYMIVVVGTRFDVAMGARQVDVSVKEGVVEVWRDGRMVRLRAGDAWRGPRHLPTVKSSKARRPIRVASGTPYRPHPADRFDQARLALATGDAALGLEILRDLATGTGPIAENSGYEIGLVLRDRMREPHAALEAWKRYRERFARGLLRAEADLSIVETELELGNRAAARLEAEAFLRRHPRSERRAEIEALVRRLAVAPNNGAPSLPEGSAEPGSAQAVVRAP